MFTVMVLREQPSDLIPPLRCTLFLEFEARIMFKPVLPLIVQLSD